MGLCEPCFLNCHAEHDIVEVGARNFFRCDCPTSKCSSACQCQPAGMPAQGLAKAASNIYGQNFEGLFCR